MSWLCAARCEDGVCGGYNTCLPPLLHAVTCFPTRTAHHNPPQKDTPFRELRLDGGGEVVVVVVVVVVVDA